ncbi:molybdopterin oxidoreductase (plasmid) [Rhizobium leguminosarum bv. trifolii WSM2304]|uniref:Molybdopterin oxidoreductase n=1 Tax=Rhizobium leguminosarum bv. trifolii (strain WSM2304) TaxID=395492 RepID=A0ABF7QZU6_RHILW|nr:molybdopterin-dependent oxidoreductase [Rhizobium leguminosarum]ACI59680.1 molybdopterin oxidoreductase [Rhizobium leguminosarum bv. trifolii WSM2304]
MSKQETPSGTQQSEFALGHWGMHRISRSAAGEPNLIPWEGDGNPSPIGLDQLSDEVQALRVRRPSFRESWLRDGAGARRERRGSDRFVEVPWDEAFELVAMELNRVIATHGNKSIFGGSYGWGSAGRFHHAQSQIHRFLNTVGGYVKGRDSYSFGAGSVIMPHIAAPMEQLLDQHTDWTTLAAHCELFVAFGGIPLRNAQMTAGGPSRHRVREALDQMRARGVRFVNVSPLKQDIDGPADWMPIRPGCDVALILGLLHVLISENLDNREFLSRYCVGAEQVKRYVLGDKDGQAKTPQWASTITGVPAQKIVELAHDIARSKTMINASWSIQRQSHGEQTYWAIVTLAAHIGQIGQSGGGFGIGYATLNSVGSSELGISGPRLSQGSNAVKEFIPVARIADALLNPGARFDYDGSNYKYPDIRLIYWAGGNPYHHHQDLNRFIDAWRKPETIIIHEQFWTSSAKAADIVLPASMTLERDDIGFASREGQLVAMKLLREPIADARSDFEIFAGIARSMGKGHEFTEGRTAEEWLEYMYEEFRQRNSSILSIPLFQDFWAAGRVEFQTPNKPTIMFEGFRTDPEGNPLKTPSGRIELFSEKIAGFGYDDCPGQATWLEPVEWLGSQKADRFPLHLLSQEPRRRLHSQLDHSPHSRAGKVKGREPILLNPKDADARGIADGQVVRVFNERGACLASAQITEDLLEGVAVIATGAWFDPTEWKPTNSLEKHGNPNAVTIDAPASKLSQATVAQSCLVQVEAFVGELPAVTAFDLPEFAPALENEAYQSSQV